MKVIDQIFSLEEIQKYHKLFLSKDYYYGEVDSPEHHPTGLVHNFSTDDLTFNEIKCRIEEHAPELKEYSIDRAYLNFFIPNENPYYHHDGDCTTVIFYVTLSNELNQNGETLFLNDNNKTLFGVLPISGRVVVFDGRIKHRATSFRSLPRITLAIKYKKTI
jgi:hypothetical protein